MVFAAALVFAEGSLWCSLLAPRIALVFASRRIPRIALVFAEESLWCSLLEQSQESLWCSLKNRSVVTCRSGVRCRSAVSEEHGVFQNSTSKDSLCLLSNGVFQNPCVSKQKKPSGGAVLLQANYLLCVFFQEKNPCVSEPKN